MTDTTDIKALREGLVEMLDHVDSYGGKCWLFPEDVRSIITSLDQLEAERQRAEALQGQLDYRNEVLTRAIRQREVAEADTEHYRKAWKDKADELAELKCDQVPVAWTSQRSLETKNKIIAFTDDMSALDYGTANGWTDIVELFTAPQKPVVNMNHIGRITAQISGQRYTYLSAEDVRNCFEEIKCQIAERTTPASNTVYVPQQVMQKLVVHRSDFESYYSGIMGTPMSVLKVLRNGDSYSATEGERLSLAWYAYQAAIEAAGGVVKDSE